MKRFLATGTTVLTVVFLAGCGGDTDQQKKQNKFGAGGTAYTDVTPTPAPSPTPDAAEPTPPIHVEVKNPNNTGVVEPKRGDIPYAKPVEGKPGFVTSPYAPTSGYVDVRGFPPGTEVKCPYSGKTFLVP
jgi:hypothetical protein